jgi:hypothetical protein
MKAADLITAAALALLGGVVLIDALRLGIGWGTDGPQSGFFPFWLALILIATCVLILIQTLRRATSARFLTRAQLDPVLRVLWPIAALVLLTEVVGLYVAALLYIGFYMRWVGRHSWPSVSALALAIPVITFVIFERWFLVPLPKGPLEHWLGY